MNDTTTKQYAERDHEAQGGYYFRHLSSMTTEGLHSKAAIAGELAHRDMQIDTLTGKLSELDRRLTETDLEAIKGRQFKKWVHDWLDAHGVPADPQPEHTATTGCRISGRMEWLKNQRAPAGGGEKLTEEEKNTLMWARSYSANTDEKILANLVDRLRSSLAAAPANTKEQP